MRHLLWLLLVAAPLAYAQYDVTVNMPLTTGTPEGCVLYLDGAAVDQDGDGSGDIELCGTSVTYPGLVSGDGAYEFAYTLVDGGVETALSPITTVQITTEVTDPTEPPSVTVECVDSLGTVIECPAEISITVQ